MKGFVCLGDPTSHGGSVITATSKIILNGKPVAQLGDLVYCPKDGHGVNPIVDPNSSAITDKTPVCMTGAKSACGCVIFSQESSKGDCK